TGLPKKGRHWVGVTRQYCGRLGKQDNCPVAVTLAPATHDASLPVAYRRYLPEDWAQDDARRHKAQIPQTSAVQTKPEIALEQIKAAQTAGLPRVYCPRVWGSWMPATAMIPAFERSTALGMSDVAGVGPNTSVGSRSVAPRPPPPRSGCGRPQKRLQRDVQHQPISVKALALSLPGEAWQTITWREGAA